jgi:hypothetical protein
MRYINFIGAKGGVGTTTLTAMIATQLPNVHVCDETGTGHFALLDPDNKLSFIERDGDLNDNMADVVVDRGTTSFGPHTDDINLLVTTNSFLGVHAALKARGPYAAIVCVADHYPDYCSITEFERLIQRPVFVIQKYRPIATWTVGDRHRQTNRRIERYGLRQFTSSLLETAVAP